MKFQYVGKGDTPPKTIVFKGLKFELNGKPVIVDDKEIAEKLANNGSFVEVKEKPKSKAKKDA